MKKQDNGLSTGPTRYYAARDLYVGAAVDFNHYRFILIDADEYAYNYMERHQVSTNI